MPEVQEAVALKGKLYPGARRAIFVHRVIKWEQAHPSRNLIGKDLWVRVCSGEKSYSAVRGEDCVDADGFEFGRKLPCPKCEEAERARLAELERRALYEKTRPITITSNPFDSFAKAWAWCQEQPPVHENRPLSELGVSFRPTAWDHSMPTAGYWTGRVEYRELHF